MRELVASKADILLITLDTLRYDAAQAAWREGLLATLAPHLGPDGWEERHSPASFTYAAHHAFLAGFLPTPLGKGPHSRLFAADFAGATSTTEETFTFQEATLPEALRARGYHTVCVGGTGFFNGQNALSRVLPGLFEESHWRPELGVTDPDSPRHQVAQALACRDQRPNFTLINVSAIHQPNRFYTGALEDNLESHTAALVAVDDALQQLFQVRKTTFVIVCSDHGTAYGEDGYHGHRLGHPVVWTVPYAHFTL
ncbi:MAG: STM4013/SEN3800 family hydrolase [Candidatus Eremiobacteraeota bacterium]|nr:STM4013/SEN3800 family hydrolase [Candidatus Eremiobacteraeota bacterium]